MSEETDRTYFYNLRDTPNQQEDIYFGVSAEETVARLLKDYGVALNEVYYETSEGGLVYVYVREEKLPEVEMRELIQRSFGEYWKSDTEDTFVDAAMKMNSYDIPSNEIVSIIGSIYSAVKDEYGE